MANLIIKPTSGGSLILQDEGGTAANTISATGNTTLAGTANNLGTVTAGSIAGGSITSATAFPAGHVCFTTPCAVGTTATNLSGTWTDTVVTTSITPLYADSSILLHANFMSYVNDNSGDVGLSVRIKKVHSGGTSYPTNMNTYSGSGGTHSTFYNNLDPGDAGWWSTYAAQDPSVGVAGSSVSYTINAFAYNSSATSTLGGGLSNRWWIYLQEVKR